MSVNALKPNFTDRETYLAWRTSWKTVYGHLSRDIRRRKNELRDQQKSGLSTAKLQKSLHLQRRDAAKMMTLLSEAKLLRDRILGMMESIRIQNALFPITMEARVVDFSFNRIHNTHPFMPRWLVRASGKTFYVNHLDAKIGFSTREMTDPNTKGMLRFRNAEMTISPDGVATITEKVKQNA